MKSIDKFVLVLVASLALLLAGCGGGSSTPSDPPSDPGPTPAEMQAMQYSEVGDAIDDAEAAVDGLTAMSSDADVTAAEALVAAARTALNGASLLSANQVNALDNRLDDIDGDLVTAKASIADHRQMVADNMMNQRNAADTAIQTAMDAVAGLSNTSTDAEVTAAKDAIQTAKDAVAAATALSMADRDSLTARIGMIETTLASTESAIANHRQMVAEENQRMGVSDAIDAAMTAVEGLSETSSDEDVAAAEGLIQAAKDALNGATSVLTAEQALVHSNRIATIEMTLGSTKTAIAAHRDQQEDDAETQRVADVAAARMAAMQSYMDADADATKAETAADDAEETSPGSPGAMAAREAATAARTAADAARAAHDAIMDDMTKAEADAQAQIAADKAGEANSSYMLAKGKNDDIQNAAGTLAERQRQRDIADAKEAANAAVMAAETAKDDAATAADAAEQARDDAHAAYMQAMLGRKQADVAKAEYEKAKAAATAARTAANNAETAYMAAMMAADGIMDDGTAEAAEMAQETAETEQGKAETAQMTAETEQGKAETAEMAAVTAAGEHVLQLFLAANGAHVTDGDDEGTSADEEKATHVSSVGAAMAAIAAATDGNQAAGTTATAAWPGDTVDDPTTAGTDESSDGMLSLTVSPAGAGNLPFELGADREADNTVTPAVTARIQTAKKIADLGFFQGYEIWEDDGDATTATDRGRVIVFTDKTQDKSPVAQAVSVTARTVLDAAITTPGELSNVRSSGRTITGVTWTPSGEGAMTGTLSCPANTACSITLGDDGAVTAITGYTFTGSREAKAAVEACDATCQATANNNYLVFGLWLDEDTTTDPNTNTFGAFVAGGAPDAIAVAVTGTATYSGKAAGAHHKTGEGVNWFDGDARLTADFGDADTAGNISGEISKIRVNGGPAMSDSIYLRQTDLTSDTATFDGDAVMGDLTAPGSATYEYEGTWSGSFFGPTADDPTTTGDGNDESITAPTKAAGTFGVTGSTGTGDDLVRESFVGAFGAHLDD